MKEYEIRPIDLLQEYLRLSAKDADNCFHSAKKEEINCPACNSSRKNYAFTKNNFKYVECIDCNTLYLSPRPLLEELKKLYNDSPSSNYWAEVFFPAVLKIRKEKIFAPRAKQISELCKKENFAPKIVIDVGAGYGLFLEEWKKLYPDADLYAVEPSKLMAETCRKKNIEVLESLAEQAGLWCEKADLLTSFEVIEHAHHPQFFVNSLYNLVKREGYVLVTGLGVEGFDIQLCWEHSKSISPPHHLNFMSIKGFETLFKSVGFKEVKIMTPGKLDIDIVINSLKEYPAIKLSRFEKTLLSRGVEFLDEFQRFLAQSKLSSHCWVFAKK